MQVRMDATPLWQFWIDRGGTFTDVVARTPDGTLCTAIERSSGEAQVLPATASVTVEAGDVMVIETPGGGGYGCP